MVGPPAAVAAVRLAVRQALADAGVCDQRVVVGCSGGADSLALAAGLAHEMSRGPGQAFALIVDHGLQDSSAQVAQQAARQCAELGIEQTQIASVTVERTEAGLEADARASRYAALSRYAADIGASAVLVGHTQDDQAESVLLGLARGSGANALAGMPAARDLIPDDPSSPQLLRPLLSVPKLTTAQCCADLGIAAWQDPHNADQRFARVRAREAIVTLDAQLGPGIGAALARSASLLRTDTEALDEWAKTAYAELGEQPWGVTDLLALPAAIRMRCWQRAAHAFGSAPGALTSTHLGEIDRLLVDWHGQGPINLPGGVQAQRKHSAVWLEAP
ncbi:tRNA lysidine(34) synthetase TilS [Ornithinimicrobium sp. Arc0846-15]|nr:tRNA lysidine(34) synthetase TilS [Ornithinimicrobium laminariae]